MMVLAGCVSPQVREYTTWLNTNLELAKAGQIKWSDFYTQGYDRIKNLDGLADKGFYLQLCNQDIDAAKSYEAGKISKDEFESYQRNSDAIVIKHNEELRRQQSLAASNAISLYLQNQAIINSQWQQRQPVYCNSYKIGNSVQTNCN